MDGQRLAVHSGHEGKGALRRRQALVMPACSQLLRQHQYLRQPPLGAAAPAKQLTARSRFQPSAKALAHGGIQRGVFGEVLLVGLLFEPKVEDGLGLQDDV